MATIKLVKNGPLCVSEDIELRMGTIKKNEEGILDIFFEDPLDTSEHVMNGYYYLCRCGHSKRAPFCDSAHVQVQFDGRCQADKSPYVQRADVQKGPNLNLLDDNHCAFARFCHRKDAEVWTLTDNSHIEAYKQEAIIGAYACPAGRLTGEDIQNLKLYDPTYETPMIIVVSDPMKHVDAGLYLRGNIEFFDENKEKFAPQNRRAVCRCGASENKPFCDATHVPIGYKSQHE